MGMIYLEPMPNTESGTKNNISNINKYGITQNDIDDAIRTAIRWYDNRQSPSVISTNISATKGSNQYIGITSGATPGALTFILPANDDIGIMDSFFFYDESQNADLYNITISCTGGLKIYGNGLSTSGETSIKIETQGGYAELLKVTNNKLMLIRKL